MKLKSVYVCSNCGETSPRWMGRCPSCGSWNTMNEDVVAEAPKAGTPAARQAAAARQEGVTTLTARRLSEISTTEEKSRILTGISELDRVLGGGIVLGGVVLLSGEPGVGKSTMLLQLCGAISNQHSVLYITGEESVRQVKLRAARLKVPQDNIFLAAENDVDEICGLIEKENFKGATLDADSDAYSAITLAAQSAFSKYEFLEDEAEFKEDTKRENGSVVITKSLVFKLPTMNAASRKAVQEIIDASYCGLVAVVITPNGDAFVVGYGEDVKLERPLRISQSTGTTGKKFSDANGDEVTLTCDHTEKSRIYSGDTDALFTAAPGA